MQKKNFLDSAKHLDHSFERLIRSSRAPSPFHREFTSSYRDMRPIISETKSHRIRDSLPITMPYRSKSYHGDLSRIAAQTSITAHHYDDYRTDLHRSRRSMSSSASNLNASTSSRPSISSFHSSYVNVYSRHHSHHNHHLPISSSQIPVQINNRSRFRARNAYKAYRSRSANRLDERDYSVSRTIRSSTPSTRLSSSTSHLSKSQDLLSTARFSKSLTDIRTLQSRINNELLRPLTREYSSSIRHIDDSTELAANHILNPDIYIRWLKNKWDMEESFRRQRSMSARSHIDHYARLAKSRFRDSSYPARVKFSHYSRQHPDIPYFSKTIRGKRYLTFHYRPFFTSNFYSLNLKTIFFFKINFRCHFLCFSLCCEFYFLCLFSVHFQCVSMVLFCFKSIRILLQKLIYSFESLQIHII